jgi:uracil-DNA glycosylase family 4
VDGNRDERLREMGLAPVWRQRVAQPAPAESAAARPGAAHALPPAAAMSVSPIVADSGTAPASASRELEIAALTWDQLAPHIAACTACRLCRTRKHTVPGVGVSTAGWMFVGEAPGAEEDALGEPFVGQAGRLFDNMLKAIGLSRTRDVYIANVLKCRPPNNRNPEPGEVAQCAPYLERQLALIQPRLIVALGRFAALTLLNTDATIASLRGRVHAYRGVPLIVTYHPAYLLRTLPDKARAWEDLLFAKRTFADLQSRESSPT